MNHPDYFMYNYIYRCDCCRFYTDCKRDFARHTSSNKHTKRTDFTTECSISPSSEPVHTHHISVHLPSLPESCHTLATTHQVAFINEKHTNEKRVYKYCDKCGQKYCSKSGLWKHRKLCDGTPSAQMMGATAPEPAPGPSLALPNLVQAGGGLVGSSDHELKTIMMDMLKNSQEFQNRVIEMLCNQQSVSIHAANNAATAAASAAATANTAAVTANNAANAAATAAAAVSSAIANYSTPAPANTHNFTGNINSNNNHHNNTFNLQFFLNEQCKDAMNITDFARSIHLKDSDLDNFGRVGYVEGMSKLFIDCLKETDVFKRPIHCSDIHRETLYVKDADCWEREDSNNTKITNAVRVVEHKNIVLVNEWAKQHPRCENSSTIENTQYINMSRAVLDGSDKNIAKVIKRVAKEVVIDKQPNTTR